MMDRRTLLGSGIATVVAVGAAPAALAIPAKPSPFLAELDAIDQESARLNAGNFDEATWDRWDEWSNRVYREIETLPPTPENAKIKARAIWSIAEGDMENVNTGQSAVARLVRQMITGLAA